MTLLAWLAGFGAGSLSTLLLVRRAARKLGLWS